MGVWGFGSSAVLGFWGFGRLGESSKGFRVLGVRVLGLWVQG